MPETSKVCIPFDLAVLFLEIYPKETDKIWKGAYTNMSIGEYFVIPTTWEQI